MWLSKKDYTALVDKAARSETRADWLMTRVNQLEMEVGNFKHDTTGRPVAIPMYAKVATPPPSDQAETSFEDMGDTLALIEGLV
jgi:hypothetical protein